MRKTQPYTLPILRFFILFFFLDLRNSPFAFLPRWKTSSDLNVFRVGGPWARLINTKRPDRLVPTPSLFFFLFVFFLALASSREMSANQTITLISIFIVVLSGASTFRHTCFDVFKLMY